MVFLVYKEVDFFLFGFVKHSVKYVQCGLEYLILFFYAVVIQFIFASFYAILFANCICLIDGKVNLLINWLVSLSVLPNLLEYSNVKKWRKFRYGKKEIFC